MRSYTKYMKKPRSHLTNAKECGILKKKRCEQAFDFAVLKTAHGRVFKSRFQLNRKPRRHVVCEAFHVPVYILTFGLYRGLLLEITKSVIPPVT